MNSFLRKFAGFILFLLPFYIVIMMIWGSLIPPKFGTNLSFPRGGNGHLFSRIKEVNETSGVDILFIGSSHAYRGFDPRIFKEAGWSNFNLGSSNQTPIQTHILLSRYLDRLNPKLVVYAISPESFSMDGVESSLDLLANSSIDSLSFSMALKLNHIKTYHALIYAFINQLLPIEDRFIEKAETEKDRYISGGFVENKLEGYRSTHLKDDLLSDLHYQWEYFDAIIERLKTNEIEVVLIQTPLSPEHYLKNVPDIEWGKRMASNGKFLDFTEIMNDIDKSCFFDANHLNQPGVERFNRELIGYLKRENLLNPHLGSK